MAGPIDRQEVDRLILEHLPMAMRFAERLASDADAAEEVVQEAMCRVLKHWQSFRGEAEFGSWLIRIVLNIEHDRRRRRHRCNGTPVDLGRTQVVGPSELATAAELRRTIRAAIDELPDRQREVAWLCLGEGLAASEVAYILEINEANVHTCLHLARKRIAKRIGVNYTRQT